MSIERKEGQVSMVIYTCNPGTGKVEAGGSKGWSQPVLHVSSKLARATYEDIAELFSSFLHTWSNNIQPHSLSKALYLIMYFFFFWCIWIWTQGLQSRCSITWAAPPVHFALVILEMESCELFAWAVSNLEPPDLSIPTSQDYRCEPWHLATKYSVVCFNARFFKLLSFN
jgi:hypothetical protein